MSDAHFDPDDLPDADVWITKATLLGLKFRRFDPEPNSSTWAVAYYVGSEAFYADWPGRAARLAIEYMLTK